MDDECVGFIHNLSPVKNGPKKKYFDFTLQTGEKTVVRAICFSPPKRKCVEQAMESASPIKVKKFLKDKKEGSTDILLGHNAVINQCESGELSFVKEEIITSALNLSMLPMISNNQLVNLKAKVVRLEKPQTVKLEDRALQKVNGVLVDPHGSVSIVLWEDDIGKVEEGGTYEFKNLRVKHNSFTNQQYVNPAKQDSSIEKCPEFAQPLAVPESIPEEFTTSSITGDVLGISDLQNTYCCLKCNKRLTPQKQAAQKVVSCENMKCQLMQKLERCKREWFVKALVGNDSGNVTLIFHHDQVLQVLAMKDAAKDTSNVGSEEIRDAFLALEKRAFVYRKKTMHVTNIA